MGYNFVPGLLVEGCCINSRGTRAHITYFGSNVLTFTLLQHRK